MSYKFTIVILQEDKFYVARCVELGVVSQGSTIEEAQANLKEAIELFLEDNPAADSYLSAKAPFITTLEVHHA
ncbi:MAG: hypothetical protein A3J07_03785 [Candidatus Doudnabacteria bacterium RIFCSPLOWO2_02_FULL_49_13]|uniref:HicB-like antitoxin of toxin-antitoxin system domain-containing protein n=1 Tax=Candidatus Doudnabacteria bacterium RIFCSPHIGHO2_12_FULL_48_16 TaxID=1817838 RepID=A0A1F5PJK9_9BACT|nr:MAG: hypothetical protein A3B77_02595 [Candidatus Doudnabacteria bacterium RIFCSPHIGHO2_02_FULL_49_24]OGE89596.1 MAG: hypothetical protein A2760_03800 [Candidatus Doudnabacteria bacterium RIFCSPHIGHO2_01_FULL_50_67]OGE90039.1 MAG: hypothetical protein A3E29_02930 [Candidatus Doudnabacteria bacterium RIFCSPHIGHO2_12_FULL_48_16]OGE96612.1 MAG: hypothetical protein A2990_00240 [Candidatus Doudnabacteria bacterium RIFCSPLOWO2_01_FULL_49_40]OGF03182.1 MAG: hypothetical protein A3J07_03785 [Candid